MGKAMLQARPNHYDWTKDCKELGIVIEWFFYRQ